MTNKDSIILHVERTSWFTHNNTEDNRLSFSTRENGNVGDETPGKEDFKKAHELAIDIKKSFDIVNVEISSVDEWVYLEFDVV